MDETTVQLLGLYAGLLLMNTLISSFMWWSSRATLHRDLLFVWAAMLAGFTVQGLTRVLAPEHDLVVILGFSTVWFANMANARLITRLVGMQMPLSSSVGLFALGIIASVAAWLAELPFVAMGMPVAIAVAYPTLYTALRAIYGYWRQLSNTARGMMLACVAISIHSLDFPVFGVAPEYAALGFTIAIIVVFALSIFAPAVILEVVASQQARVAAEMDVAHRIQMKVLPRDPKVPGLEVTGYMQPADEVGGDYYDVYSLGKHSWILLGDVTGHGLSSGLVMLMAQSILASILHTRTDISPAELNWLANRVLYQNLRRLDELRSMTIVTLCRVGDDQRFIYSGNHDHMYVYRAKTGEVESIEVAQVPHDLGFMNEFPLSAYSEGSFTLDDGDLLFITTDGVTEAARHGHYSEGMFESERVVGLLKEHAQRPLEEIKQRILQELERYTGGIYHDDVTFLLARAVPGGAPA